jgi:hypothetical protein
MSRITPLGLAITLALASAAPLAAQTTAGDTWQVTIAPYFMGASMSGTTAINGREVEVDVSASDIFSNLQFGAMGVVAARKGNWGLGSDLIWMALGTTVRNTNVDFNQGAFAFYGLRRLSPVAELTFGIRVNTLQGELRFKEIGVDVSGDKTWVDPIVGLNLRSPGDRRWHAGLYSEIGGFGAGSTFAWQIFPTVGVNVSKRASIDFGYRWLDLDYESGDAATFFKYDVLTQGPVIGLAFRF